MITFIECFIEISGTDKTENLTDVKLFMIISYVKIIAFQTVINHSFWIFYISRKDRSLYNKQKNTWVLGNTRCKDRDLRT